MTPGGDGRWAPWLLVGEPTADARARLAEALRDESLLAIEHARQASVREADVVFIWDFRAPELARLWPRMPRLQWVHTASAGVDHVVTPDLIARNPLLTNSAGIFDQPIAEYVIGLALAHRKGLVATVDAQRARQWHYRMTHQLAGTTMVIVGLGRIGSAVAALARALGVHTVGVRRGVGGSRADTVDRLVSVDEWTVHLPDADFIVVTAPLTSATHGLVDRSAIAQMRTDAYLINVARSAVVETDALVEALTAGSLAGAALDVFDEEPLRPDSPLWTVPNLLISPHMSGDVVGWDAAVVDIFVDNAGRYRRGGPLVNRVDLSRGY